MGKKTSVSAPAPDPNIGKAAMKQAELGEEFLAFAKEQSAIMNARQEKVDALTERVVESQLKAQDTASQWAAEDRDRYKSTYQPLEDQYLEDVHDWDSPERQAKLGAEARASVINQAAIQKEGRQRQMAAMGVDPRTGRYAGIERNADVHTALAAAGAENNAANTVRNQAIGLRSDAINMGRGLPSQAQSALGLGVNSGNAAVGNQASANAQAAATFAPVQAGYGMAMQGYSGMGNMLQNQYNSQLSAWSTQQQLNAQSSSGLFGGIGNLVGTLGSAAIMASSKEVKEDKRPPAKSLLEAVQEMPVEEWKYKEGVADSGQHVGPYAEDFKAATGKGDGKTIPVVDAIGVTMGAVQELAEEVRRLRDNQTGQARKTSRPRDNAGYRTLLPVRSNNRGQGRNLRQAAH